MGRFELLDLRTELAAVPDSARIVDPGLDIEALAAGHGRADRVVVDVWIFEPGLDSVLLVRHPRRGWVMPGGKVEAGETFRSAAVRELWEETGITLDAAGLRPVGAYLGDDPDSPGIDVGISFATLVDRATSLRAEPGQPARWWSLRDEWESIYPHDRPRLLAQRERWRSV